MSDFNYNDAIQMLRDNLGEEEAQKLIDEFTELVEQAIDDAVGSIKEEQSWLVTYADMMTLLFAFFVLLFSLSTIDPVKVSKMQDGMGDQPELKSFNEVSKEFQEIIEELNIEDKAKAFLPFIGVPVYTENRTELAKYEKYQTATGRESLVAAYDLYSESRIS